MRENKNTKVKMILNTGKIDEIVADFHSQIEINLEGTDKNELLNEMIARIDENIANFQQRGSNWVFVSINQLEIHLVDFIPLGGSSYIPLPKKIRDKKAIINLTNEDDQCFKWSVVRALLPVKDHPERITKTLKEHSERFNWSGLPFPVKLKDIIIFEKLNPKISINVFGFEEGFYPLRISKTKRRINIDLLLISDGEK